MKNYAAKYMLEEFLGKEHKKEVDFSKNISDVADLALLSNLYECCEEIIGGEPNDLEIIKQKERLSCIEKRIKEVLQINTELAPLALVLDDLDGAFRKPVVWVGERIIELLKEKEPTFTEINRITKFFIRSVDLRTISQSKTTGLDNEVMITVVMDFEWLNLRSGGRIMGRKNFSSSALFVPSRPSAEPIEMGQFAVIQQLSQDIVDQMQSSW